VGIFVVCLCHAIHALPQLTSGQDGIAAGVVCDGQSGKGRKDSRYRQGLIWGTA